MISSGASTPPEVPEPSDAPDDSFDNQQSQRRTGLEVAVQQRRDVVITDTERLDGLGNAAGATDDERHGGEDQHTAIGREVAQHGMRIRGDRHRKLSGIRGRVIYRITIFQVNE
jgi:hypothetical protein